MNTQIKKITLIFISLLLMSPLAACDTIMEAANDAISPVSKLQKVCNQEGGVEEAGTYNPSQVNSVAFFMSSSASDNNYEFVSINNPTHIMGEDFDSLDVTWGVQSQEADPAGVELVACVIRSNENLAGTCEYEDETDVSKEYVLELYDASYEVKVFVAKTGEELGSTTVDVETSFSEDDCPSTWYFTSSKDASYPYLENNYDVMDFIRQYAEPGE